MDDAELLDLYDNLVALSKKRRSRKKSRTVQKRKTAVLYLRVSDRSQVETDFDPEGNSIPTQRGLCFDYAKRRELSVLGEYCELGASARSIHQRPEFRKLIRRIIEKKDVGYVIVYKLSRTARDRIEDAIIELILSQYDVVVVSATEGLGDNDTTSDRSLRGFLALTNQLSSDTSGDDIAVKMGNKAKNGGTVGFAPIGYENTRLRFDGHMVNTVQPDPDRAQYIKDIHAMWGTGRYSAAHIRETVTERGLRTRGTRKHPPGPVSLNTILKILTDRYYLGYVTYDGVEYRGRHEPLITEEVWKRSQQVFDASPHAGVRRMVHSHPLKGVLWCGRCQRRLILAHCKGNGGAYQYYFCMGRMKKTCDLPYLRTGGAAGLEAAVSGFLAGEMIPEQTRQELVARADREIMDAASTAEDARETITRALADVDRRQERYMDMAEDPAWESVKDKTAARIQKLHDEKTALERQLAELDTTAQNTTGRDVLALGLELLERPRDFYDRGDDHTRSLLLVTLYSRLYVDSVDDATTVTDVDRAEPFETIHEIHRAHAGEHLIKRPARDGGRSGTCTGRQRKRGADAARVGPSEDLGSLPVPGVTGSNKLRHVGLTGFEPATP
ncbi:hypothetical protein DMC64_34550 [Amycolatopsis sp. WAC 04197]|uniref:recombinase family protein n=1 Tax=Amycolatopsis sp. WAC 04197 TaxID=2203199 RepID=UPI000F7B19B0|nr:recombinase family protein [Amycolatopsis sp. WAC 04197]RSN40057.1 hypothetical protein DMC64_34550 [Amycolatopsis sp. WAC 04197]